MTATPKPTGRPLLTVEECVYWLAVAAVLIAVDEDDKLVTLAKGAIDFAVTRRSTWLRYAARALLDDARGAASYGKERTMRQALALRALCREAGRAIEHERAGWR